MEKLFDYEKIESRIGISLPILIAAHISLYLFWLLLASFFSSASSAHKNAYVHTKGRKAKRGLYDITFTSMENGKVTALKWSGVVWLGLVRYEVFFLSVGSGERGLEVEANGEM